MRVLPTYKTLSGREGHIGGTAEGGRIKDGGIGEGVFEGIILYFSLTQETFWFTLPPAVALLNKMKL
jgi:hypothetical protein